MEIEHYFEEAMAQNDSFGEDCKSSLEKWSAIPDSENITSGAFDCNICLETVQDPVVTLCGHLYCWPCLYKWLHFQSLSAENQDEQQQQCPVCKAEISQASLVPLYGKGQTTKPSKGKASHLGTTVIPRRPPAPACGVDTPRSTQQLHHGNYSYQSRQYHPNPGGYGTGTTSSTLTPSGAMANMFDPTTGVFGETFYARVFGDTITNLYTYPNSYHLVGGTSPRYRRHVMQADKSLNRICFFLFCCAILCLLSF